MNSSRSTVSMIQQALEPGGVAQEQKQLLQLAATTVLVVLVAVLGCVQWANQGVSVGFKSKGTMGWPIIGETLSFLNCGLSYSLEKWLGDRLKRYGPMFKTHLLLQPCVVATGPEEVRIILDDHEQGFLSGAPHALTRIFGTKSILALSGAQHRDMHKLMFDSLLMPAIKPKVPEMERLLLHVVESWKQGDGRATTVNFVSIMQHTLLKIMTLNFFGIPWEDALSDKIVALLLPAFFGISALPIYLPGTKYYRARQARKELNALLIPIIESLRDPERASESKYAVLANFPYKNLLSYVDRTTGQKYSDEGVVDILVGTILSGIHAPTIIVSVALKYLAENPTVLETLVAEGDKLRDRKEASGEAFCVADLKELKYNMQVYQEVLRITNIASGVSRLASRDMKVNGYLIPKGWRTFVVFSMIHLAPEFYPNPLEFDPGRFEVPPNPRKFLPFGRGPRTCVGRDISKLIIMMTLYHITSKFTWEVVSPDLGMSVLPIRQFKGPFILAMKQRNPNDLCK